MRRSEELIWGKQNPLSPCRQDVMTAKGPRGLLRGEAPRRHHFGSKGRANSPKLPEEATSENSPADAIETANGRTERRSLTGVA